MSLTNPPPIITQFDTQLRACADFYSGATTWYPEAPEGTAGPYYVLGFGRQTFTKYAEGAAPTREGELFFTAWKADTIGNLESHAQAMVAQLMTQDTGIPFRDSDAMTATDLGNARVAAGETLLGVSATLTHGLTP